MEMKTQAFNKLCKSKLLIVEEESSLLRKVKDLVFSELELIKVVGSEKGIRAARSELPSAVLIVVFAITEVWIEFIELIKGNEATKRIPIFIISHLSPNEKVKVRAFRAGLDDFICNHCSPLEIEARISTKISRLSDSSKQKVLECSNLVLDLDKIEARVDNQVIGLSVLEFDLLRYFVQNESKVLSRRKILEAVWRDSVVSDRTVDAHIACLRRKLSSCHYTFAAVYGAGYTLKLKKRKVDESFEQQTIENHFKEVKDEL